MTKAEKLHHTKTVLLSTAQFLQKLLPLANAHNCDFITRNLWDNLLTQKITDKLSLLSEEELKQLVIYDTDESQGDEFCLKQVTNINSAQETLKQFFPSTRQQWDKNQTVKWDSAFNLEDYRSDIALHIKQIKDIIATPPDLYLAGKNKDSKNTLGEVHIPHGMTEKKSHEIQIMTELCASFVQSHGLTQVIDIGSGRGYLGCQLSLTHGLRVLGIDSSPINTKSAERRTSKVQKYWPGLMRKAQKNVLVDTMDSKVTDRGAAACSCPKEASVISRKHQTKTNQNQIETEDISREPNFNEPYDKLNLRTNNHQKSCKEGCDKKDTAEGSQNERQSKDSDSKTKDRLYVPITCYVTPATDIWQLVYDNMPGIVDTNKQLCTVLLTGLHTCGDLASSMLRLFITNQNVKGVCNVGCCYHHIEEEFVCSPFKSEEENCGSFGFPLSQTLRETRFQLGRNARMLACQSIDRIAQNQKLADVSLYWRALLQVILRDLTGELRDDWQVGRIAAKCPHFKAYVKKALVKLKIDAQLTDADIEAYEDKYRPYHHKLLAFFQLKAALSPVIELFILVDRLCFLLEQETTKDAHLVRLFDEVVSPRCYAIVATK